MVNNDWEGKFGIVYDALVDLILGRENGDDGWLDTADSSIYVDQGRGFGINFLREPKHPRDVRNPHDVEFGLIFNYNNNSEDVRLHNVFIDPDSQRGHIGGNILIHVAKTALLLGCKRIFVKPTKMGSYYWPRHGAIILQWPPEIDQRFRNLIENRAHLAGWKEKDIEWLQAVYDRKDPRQLSVLATSDLKAGKIRVGEYILRNIDLGSCIFDLNDDWTKQRLREKLGFDVDVFRAGRGDASIDRSMISGTKRRAAVKTAES